MSSIDAKRAHAARESRRRHLQQRQTVIFGSLIAGLLVIGLAAGAVWVGILPAPIDIPIHSSEDEDAVDPPPCPPADAPPVPFGEIATNVLNGTNQQGLAASTSTALSERGVIIGQQDNASIQYEATAQITTGPNTVASAYTLAALFPESEIRLDARDDETLTVVIGSGYSGLVPEDEVELDAETPLEPLPGCREVILEDEDDGSGEGEGDDGDGGDEG